MGQNRARAGQSLEAGPVRSIVYRDRYHKVAAAGEDPAMKILRPLVAGAAINVPLSIETSQPEAGRISLGISPQLARTHRGRLTL